MECSEFVTQTIGCMTLAIETRSTKIVMIAIDLLTQLMKVGAVHGTFPLSKDQSGSFFIDRTTLSTFFEDDVMLDEQILLL